MSDAADRARPEEPAPPPKPADTGLRILGMVVGGGAGALFLVLLGSYGHLDPTVLIPLPGVGLAAISGAFALRRVRAWGGIAACAGVVWTVLVWWLRHPTRASPLDAALALLGSGPGFLQLALVVVAGVLLGAGWNRSPAPAPDPDADAGLWD